MKVTELLSKAKVEVSSETYAVLAMSSDDWFKLLEDPEKSPRMLSPFMIFKDKWEVTLVLDEIDFEKISESVEKANVERNFRLLSFDVDLDFDVVGFMALIARIFAEANISILPISSFSRDHVLIKQDDLAVALKALRGHVDEIC